MLGVTEARVSRELAGAIRRSEPDAREVYGVIHARRFVARRVADGGGWTVSLEPMGPQPSESQLSRTVLGETVQRDQAEPSFRWP